MKSTDIVIFCKYIISPILMILSFALIATWLARFLPGISTVDSKSMIFVFFTSLVAPMSIFLPVLFKLYKSKIVIDEFGPKVVMASGKFIVVVVGIAMLMVAFLLIFIFTFLFF